MKKSMEIKNVKTWNGHDGIGLNCIVYLNGKRAFEYLDNANGGGGDISYRIDKELTKKIEDWIDSQPAVVCTEPHAFEYKYNIDNLINDLHQKYTDKKFDRAKQKKMLTCIIIEHPDKNGYRYYKFPRNLSLIPVDLLKQHIVKIKSGLKLGEKIVNTNLPTV